MPPIGSAYVIVLRQAFCEIDRTAKIPMTAPVWLIAEREFRTYVATASFWVALAIGPIGAGIGLLLTASPTTPPAVQIHADNERLARSATAALEEAGRLEGQRYAIGNTGAILTLNTISNQVITARFSVQFPLSATGRALFARTLERDAARLATNGAFLTVRENLLENAPRGPDAAALSRFILMLILWLTLTGSLGMLLQAVVRERVNRSLESLLAAARAWEIVAGKLVGVGGISLLVLLVWLGSMVVMTSLLPSGMNAPFVLLKSLTAPVVLLRAVAIYILAYAFYGSLILAVGALARDAAAAQNLSRPMFILLLAVFFVALVSVSTGGTGSFSWLLYIPPFTPFLLLLEPPGAIAITVQILVLGFLLVMSVLATTFAASRLSLTGRSFL
jgi:ABC-2 type transport system permease protein